MRDFDDLFRALGRSRFRRRFQLSAAEAAYLERKGLGVVLQHAETFIRDRLAPAQPRNDGRQTPWRGHPVFVAQHATATCCRSCLSKWHEIETGRPLSAEHVDYLVRVLRRWLEPRIGESGPPSGKAGRAGGAGLVQQALFGDERSWTPGE